MTDVELRVEALSLSDVSAIPPEYVRLEEERTDLGDALEVARAASDDADAARIPVVDISAFDGDGRRACVEAVRAAAEEWGVMHIAGHGLPGDVLDRLRAAGEAFFALPIAEKEAYANDPAAGRLQGYGSKLAANASGKREWEDYLFHLVHPDHLADHSLWPANPPEYVPVSRDFGGRVRTLASKLLAILSLGLGLPEETLERRLRRHDQHGVDDDLLLQLKINYYPRCPRPDLAVGVEAHTDVSALSFILHNGVPGLQAHHAGTWVMSPRAPNRAPSSSTSATPWRSSPTAGTPACSTAASSAATQCASPGSSSASRRRSPCCCSRCRSCSPTAPASRSSRRAHSSSTCNAS